jgi:hypothetical protein
MQTVQAELLQTKIKDRINYYLLWDIMEHDLSRGSNNKKGEGEGAEESKRLSSPLVNGRNNQSVGILR